MPPPEELDTTHAAGTFYVLSTSIIFAESFQKSPMEHIEVRNWRYRNNNLVSVEHKKMTTYIWKIQFVWYRSQLSRDTMVIEKYLKKDTLPLMFLLINWYQSCCFTTFNFLLWCTFRVEIEKKNWCIKYVEIRRSVFVLF